MIHKIPIRGPLKSRLWKINQQNGCKLSKVSIDLGIDRRQPGAKPLP